jgi:ERCC4-type nuclease
MLFVDTRAGSKDLVDPLRKAGMVVDPVMLDAADVEFYGRGVGGTSTSIGVELKHLYEICTDWDRLCGVQVVKMLPAYDHRWLIVEGEWAQDRQGRLVKRGKGGKTRPYHGENNASALRKKLLTLEMCAGMHVRLTRDTPDTVRFLNDLYRWWNDGDLDKHRSHLVLYHPVSLIQDSAFVSAVSAWPTVGRQRAKAAERVFKTVRRAVLATESEWAGIETVDVKGNTRRIGKDAARIVHFLEGAL